MRELVAPHWYASTRRRYPDWLDPPSCCDACGGPAVMVLNRAIHGGDVGEWPVCWFCLCCEAAVGCHYGSVYPKGRMADAQTRAMRVEVHRLFDVWWGPGVGSRSAAYARLGRLLGSPRNKVPHIGEMSLEACYNALKLLRDAELAEDFPDL